MAGLGANPPEDAVYPLNVADADGQPLDGDHAYRLHFDKDELPPVGAFWSVTMYDADGFQAANPLNRFALGDATTSPTTTTVASTSTSSTTVLAPTVRPSGCRHPEGRWE